MLAAAPPSVAKEWAQRAGASGSLLELPQRRSSQPEPVAPDEAYWATPAMIDTIAAIASAQGEHPAEARLLQSAVVDTDYVDDVGVNDTRRVFLSNGEEGYHKAFTHLDDEVAEDYGHQVPLQPVHEVAAWILARELGGPWDELVPPCVLRVVEGRLGSFSLGVPGAPLPPLGVVSQEHLDAAAFFDALSGQQDRHTGNLLVDGTTLHLIDHGFTFALPDSAFNMSALHRYRREHQPAITAGEISALGRLLESPNLLGLAKILEPGRAAALRDRAELMRSTLQLPRVGEF